MIACKIVQENGVAMLLKINVAPVIMIVLMTVHRTVLMFGVVQIMIKDVVAEYMMSFQQMVVMMFVDLH